MHTLFWIWLTFGIRSHKTELKAPINIYVKDKHGSIQGKSVNVSSISYVLSRKKGYSFATAATATFNTTPEEAQSSTVAANTTNQGSGAGAGSGSGIPFPVISNITQAPAWWQCIAWHESSDNLSAVNGYSGDQGIFQDAISTWREYAPAGYPSEPIWANFQQQYNVNELIYKSDGSRPWVTSSLC